MKILPIVVLHRLEETEVVLSALQKKGINCAEITFRTPIAAEAIERACKLFPSMEIGAGTVISRSQCEAALKAGAKFIVSPGLSEEVAKFCREKNIPYYPGCVTPTEIMRALSLGLDTVKFFPADVYGGPKAIKALSAPFPQVKFIPTGGVNSKNIEEYAACGCVVAVGGSSFTEEALKG